MFFTNIIENVGITIIKDAVIDFSHFQMVEVWCQVWVPINKTTVKRLPLTKDLQQK